MNIKYAIDSKYINEYHNNNLITLQGWCINEDGTIPELNLYVNGEKQKFRIKYYARQDVLNVLKKGLYKEFHFQTEDLNKSYDCGFQIVADHIPGDMKTIALKAENQGQKESIIELNRKEIRKNSTQRAIIYIDDSIMYDEAAHHFTIKGWVLSIFNLKTELNVIDYRTGEIIPAKIDRVRRPDVLNLFLKEDGLDENCGFRITVPVDKEREFKVIAAAGSNVETIFLNKKQAFAIRRPHFDYRKARRGLSYLKHHGVSASVKMAKKYIQGGGDEYNMWLMAQRPQKKELAEQRMHHFDYEPKISLIVPSYNTPAEFLHAMIHSVLDQSYSNWELCIADGSDKTNPARKILNEYAAKDDRIKLKYLDQNYGISGNTNKALELVTGEYTAMFDHDDLLEPHALYEIVKAINTYHCDIVYTDEDKYITESKRFAEPNLKPDFSIDLLRSNNYITHLFTVKTDILRKVGGFHSDYDGSQDYDVILRCIEQTDRIYHLPEVLYHWRIHGGSTSADPESKMYCYTAAERAIRDHLEREHIEADVHMYEAPYYFLYHVKYKVKDDPLVSVIIPNYENKTVLENCLTSLFKVNNYQNIEVVIVENNSTSQEIFDYYDYLQKTYSNVRVVRWEGKTFNFSAINNYGVSFAKGKYLLFLNNDTKMIAPDSIREMVGIAQRNDVGIVGAKLLYDDDTVQHAGVVIGFGGTAGHIFSRIGKDESGYMSRALVNGDYSAVTGACMMIAKDLFEEAGGFSEDLAVAYNDIDLCLKIRARNKLVVYTPFSLWYHYESISRGYETTPEKQARFQKEADLFHQRWKNEIENGDPYYNPNFALSRPFQIRKPDEE